MNFNALTLVQMELQDLLDRREEATDDGVKLSLTMQAAALVRVLQKVQQNPSKMLSQTQRRRIEGLLHRVNAQPQTDRTCLACSGDGVLSDPPRDCPYCMGKGHHRSS